MSETEAGVTPDEEIEPVEPEDEAPEEEDADSGLKKALAAERKRAKVAERRARAAEQQLADKDKPAEEQALEVARREAREEALSEANARVVKSELKAALAGKVSNIGVALKLIDSSSIEVDDDGEVDADAVSAAIDALLDEAPQLAASKSPGSADQGRRGDPLPPEKPSANDLIRAARKKD